MGISGLDGGPLGSLSSLPPLPARDKPHDLAKLHYTGYLERLGFKYRPATPATMYRHPSKLGMRP